MARLRHCQPRLYFVAHGDHGGRRWADEGDSTIRAHFGEAGVFGEEAIPRVDCFAVRQQRRADEVGDIEVTLAALRRANADALVRQAHGEGITIGLGVRNDGLDAELAAGAQDTQRDLATVGDQEFLEHASAASQYGLHDPAADAACVVVGAAVRGASGPATARSIPRRGPAAVRAGPGHAPYPISPRPANRGPRRRS